MLETFGQCQALVWRPVLSNDQRYQSGWVVHV